MHLAVGTKVTFQEQDLIALIRSDILTLAFEGQENATSVDASRADMVVYIREEADDHITATSSSGYKMQCEEISREREWTFEILVAPVWDDDEA